MKDQQNNSSFSEEELRRAARIVGESMRDTLPAPEECKADFSPEFTRRMQKRFGKTQRRARVRRVLRSTAAVFAAMAIFLGSCIAVDPRAQAVLKRWSHYISKNYITYSYQAPKEEIYLPGPKKTVMRPKRPRAALDCNFTWLPEELESTLKQVDKNILNKIWVSSKYGFEFLCTTQPEYEWYMLGGTIVQEECMVNDYKADIYRSDKETALVWCDEELGVLFRMSARGMDLADMIKIAEGIELVEPAAE